MQVKRMVLVLILSHFLVGCGKSEPPRSGGRTASYWADVLQKPDPDIELRRKAAAKLGPLVLMDPCVMPALVVAVKDMDPDVRAAAVRSLTIYSGPTKAAEVLEVLTDVQQHDSDSRIREAASQSIDKLTSRKK